MDSDSKSRLYAGFLTAILVFSSIVFLGSAKAEPSDDLGITTLYEPPESPPPRVNTLYEVLVFWENSGDSDYNAKVRLYLDGGDCEESTGTLQDESDSFDMNSGESGDVTLEVTFLEVGEACVSASVYYDGADYGFEIATFFVEPESGEADLWIEITTDLNQAEPGEFLDIEFVFGNEGTVSTQNSVTIAGYFDPISDDPSTNFGESPFTFPFLSPSIDDEEPTMGFLWQHEIPSDTEEGMYKYTVIIDSENLNNDEDPVLSNNTAILELCVGDCTEPDLIISSESPDAIRAEPVEPTAGTTITFEYTIENIGEGEAKPPGPFSDEEGDFVVHLEVLDCSLGGTDPCRKDNDGNYIWNYVNTSRDIRTPLESGQTLDSPSILAMNWTTTPEDYGLWNVRVVVDAENVIDETHEENNDLDWHRVHNEYFMLEELRPDLVVQAIDPGLGVVYQHEKRTVSIAVAQTQLGDVIAENVEVSVRYMHEDFTEYGPYVVTGFPVGNDGNPTFFEYTWIPEKLGAYEFSAYVDEENKIKEWIENNNQLSDFTIEVKERLPDLQVSGIYFGPLNSDGQGMVGVSSFVNATISNLGVRNMTDSEASKLEVTFYDVRSNKLISTVNVADYGSANLTIGESIDISVPFIYTENKNYEIEVMVDSDNRIRETDEFNNAKSAFIYAVSSIDAFVSDLSVEVNEGRAGKDHPITFDVGMNNIPEEGNYRVYFNVSVDGTFGWGEKLALSMKNETGFYPVGVGYAVSGNYAYIDFNSSYTRQTVNINWIPSADRSDNYTIVVDVSSHINVDDVNDKASVDIDIVKLTTNLRIKAIKVTDSDGSATIKVTVNYEMGEKDELNTWVGLDIYQASDYENGGAPVDSLTNKEITQLMKKEDRQISFTWAIKNTQGSYVFVATVDPDDEIRELNEGDNVYPSLEINFGDSDALIDTEDEDGGLLESLPGLSMFTAISLIGIVALARRRS